MATRNHSTVHMFVLVGLNRQPELQLPLFLHFLGLSFIDLCCSSLITPKMLVNFLGKKNTILYSECMAQLFFFAVFAVAESYLLTAMAFDLLVSFTLAMMKLDFCQPHIISHYFCDVLPRVNLSCSSTHLNELLLFFIAGFNTLVPTLAVAVSYTFIFCSVLRIQSSEGRSKAFGTCSSHLLTVGIFFGSITYMYFKPPSSNSLEQEKVSSVFYTTVIRMLNPLIYSLSNQDVKKTL
uniref:G-protein coupled receptors family 1 profile domain-containing protein n=1 Tax=Cavia porcellus TaxID=10141 RepID=A0A286XGL9_CAVPO